MSVRLRRFCSTMTDSAIARLIKAAQSERCGSWRSHTDRYRNDSTYRAHMTAQVPPIPEWLVFSSGEVARLDGQPASEY